MLSAGDRLLVRWDAREARPSPCPSAEGLTNNCTKHDMRTRVTYGIVITMMLIMNLIMVAEGMDPSTPSGSGSGASGSGMTNTMTIGKAFGHSTKLDKANFDVWLAGLISALAGLSIGIYKSRQHTQAHGEANVARTRGAFSATHRMMSDRIREE